MNEQKFETPLFRIAEMKAQYTQEWFENDIFSDHAKAFDSPEDALISISKLEINNVEYYTKKNFISDIYLHEHF